jgi:hypothetical protein
MSLNQWMVDDFCFGKSQLVLPWFFRAILGLRHLKPLEFHSRMRHGFTLLKLAQWPQVACTDPHLADRFPKGFPGRVFHIKGQRLA